MNQENKRSLLLGKIDEDIIPLKLTKEKIEDIENLFIINYFRFAAVIIGAVDSDYKDNTNKRYSKLEIGVPLKFLAYIVKAAFNGAKCKEFSIYITRQDMKNVVWNYKITMPYCYIVETTTLPGAQYSQLVQNQAFDTEYLLNDLKLLDGPQSKPASNWLKYRSNSTGIISDTVEEPIVVFSVLYNKLLIQSKTSKSSKKGIIGAAIYK